MSILRSIDSKKIIRCEYNTHPHDLSCTHDRRPQINVGFENIYEDLYRVELCLYLDDEIVEFQWSDDLQINYLPEKDLEYGEHKVRLVIPDRKNGEFHINWMFYVTDKNKTYNTYYGNPHSHTSYSDGKETPTDAFEYARGKGLDFLIISDHVGRLLKNNLSYDNSISFHGCKYPKWEMTKLEAEQMNLKYDDFVAIAGYELSTVFWGHINIMNCDELVNKKKFMIRDMIQWIHSHEDILLAVNHPFKRVGTLKCDTPFIKSISLYEYGNGCPPRVYNRCEERYYTALDDGWIFGAINGQDNHDSNWGDAENLTGVLAENLTKAELISAMKMRRVFSTESKTLRLSFKVDGYWMGSILNVKVGERLRAEIDVEDKVVDIEKVQLISNGGVVIHEHNFGESGIFKCIVDITTAEKNTWYLVKVFMKDDKVGISSPVFLRYNGI